MTLQPRDSRDLYAARLHRVLEHIDAHLDEPLDLARLAAVAHFSPFHFHRLFAAWTGERLGDHLRRRRLEVAAARLAAQPALSVLTVALAVGFGSGEAFSRAFKLHFGATPSAWRRQTLEQRRRARPADGKTGQADRKIDQAGGGPAPDDGRLFPQPPDLTMTVTLETLPPTEVAYLRRTGAYGAAVNRFWIDEVEPWMRVNGLLGRVRYGISHDDPSIAAPSTCRYDACVEVPAAQPLAGQPQRTVLPGGRYAVRRYRGTAAAIGDAWATLLRDWLPGSGLQLDARPCFEQYLPDAWHDPATGAFECRICVPVAPL